MAVSIPSFNDIGVLPMGEYRASIEEIKERFCSIENGKIRSRLFSSFTEYVEALRQHNVKYELYVDGSFITNKEDPSDIDVLVFFDFEYNNKKWLELINDSIVRYKYKGIQVIPGFLDSFSRDEALDFAHNIKSKPGHKKGLIKVIL